MTSENQKVQFGKHKGRLVSWVIENDYPYAMWLLKGSNSSTKTKRAIQSLLDKKKKVHTTAELGINPAGFPDIQ